MTPNIPKIIHLCWFSGDEYPKGIKECLDSWKRVIPDYHVKLWTKDMALATGIPFVKEAIEQRKWAFAADVMRLYALYNDGGIYADSDIYFLKRFDELLTDKLILFIEMSEKSFKKANPAEMFSADGTNLMKDSPVNFFGIQAALMVSEPKHPFIGHLLEYYKNLHFIHEDGTLHMDSIAPQIYAKQIERWGFRYKNEKQKLQNSIVVYPAEYVGGNNYLRYKNSIAVHCVSHSWKPATNKEKTIVRIKKIIKKFLFMKDKATVKSFEKY